MAIVQNLSKNHLAKAHATMRGLSGNHWDECGEMNHTSLAEETAAALDLYEDEDFKIHDEIFELAVEMFP